MPAATCVCERARPAPGPGRPYTRSVSIAKCTGTGTGTGTGESPAESQSERAPSKRRPVLWFGLKSMCGALVQRALFVRGRKYALARSRLDRGSILPTVSVRERCEYPESA